MSDHVTKSSSTRTRQARHAAIAFCAIALCLYILVNLFITALPSLMHWFVLPALGSMFLVSFGIWWLLFPTVEAGVIRAVPAGFLIANLWPAPLAVGVFMGGIGLPGILQLETWTPAFMARAALFSVPYILIAFLIRWRQVKAAAIMTPK